ncbi:PH domain containing protein [Trichomonas vaginalis G3]|uniref:PH domain containing protein n=1 Tax=Trichomonas vaginalis (strain ATCC PRA-98 / G3) TaxID=412133 RepID=A2EIJ2_TRIV3|nr:PH domain-like family [Trichomonas vaginalis G3]EAY07513.1 PH domain containing protein [Trichomonas vaginalis G3]KAI5550533.1 PH domain-like family [Trichomonas vaginalis G3]|eukprot:XP_001319736.1 PH domain containing protein [Trichomonas vaginalis G3]
MSNEILRSGLMKKEGHFIHNINQRYFELTFDDLTYYTSKGGEQKGKISIDSLISISSDPTYKIQPCMVIKQNKGKEFKLIPPSVEEFNLWEIYLYSIMILRRGTKNQWYKDNFKKIFNDYICITELIWSHNSANIQQIVGRLHGLIQQGLYTRNEILEIITYAAEKRPREVKFFGDLTDTFLHSEGYKIPMEHKINNSILRNVLIMKNQIKNNLPDDFKDLSVEEIMCGFKQSDYRYAIFYDKVDLFKQAMKEDKFSDPENCYKLACKYSAVKHIQLLTKEHQFR